MKSEREIKESIPFTIATKRIKYLGINSPKETKELYTENSKTLMKDIKDYVNRLERYSMFLGRNNQYCENDYNSKCNLQIQCSPYEITNGIFHRIRTKNFTVHMETQKTPNSQSSLEKEEWSWRNQPACLQIILQRYSHQDSMVLAPKQTYRPMEQIETQR